MQNKKITVTRGGKQDNKIVLSTDQNNEPAKWTKKRILNTIGSCCITLLIAIPCWMLLGMFISRSYGYDASETVIENTLLAIQDNNTSKIAKAFYTGDKNAENTQNNLQEYATSVKGTYSVKLDSTYTMYDEKNINTTEIKQTIGFKPDEAKYTVANIESPQTRNGIKCDGIAVYEIITYEYKDKWYIASFSEIGYEIIDIPSQNISADIVGSNSLGWIRLNSNEWSYTDTKNELFNDTETSCYKYKGEDHNSTIILSAIHDDITIDEAVNKIQTNIENDEKFISTHIMETVLNGTKCEKIMSVHINEDNTSSVMYTWLYKNILKDEYVHQITVITTSSEAVYPFIMTYTQ